MARSHYTIEVNGNILEDDFGDAYHFSSIADAEDFAEENELEPGTYEIVRQY